MKGRQKRATVIGHGPPCCQVSGNFTKAARSCELSPELSPMVEKFILYDVYWQSHSAARYLGGNVPRRSTAAQRAVARNSSSSGRAACHESSWANTQPVGRKCAIKRKSGRQLSMCHLNEHNWRFGGSVAA